jgi:hypothetical protein
MNKVKYGYALFNKNNTLVCDRIYSDPSEAEPIRKYLCPIGDNKEVSIWKVSLTMEARLRARK